LFWLLLTLILIQASCRQDEPTPVSAPKDPAPVVPTVVPAKPASFPAQVANYNLGETTILQDHYPEDSPFRHMPVRLNGVIGVPESEGQHPIVLIMHGKHAECPVEFEWPCSAEEEQKNYEGFTYLVEALAEAGYVALSINVNAEHTLGFGEAPTTARTKLLIERHLKELAAANDGQSSAFGVDVTGRVDLDRMAWLGHSRGGEFANWIIRDHNLDQSANEAGYGPVQGLIQVASPVAFIDALPAADLSTALILPACDWDVLDARGQRLYESARFDPDRLNLITSVYLEHANHNNFNTVLPTDPIIDDRPDCAEDMMLAPEMQREFLTQYTVDFLQTLFAEPDPARTVEKRLGILASEPVSEELHGTAARVNLLLPRPDTLLLMLPESETELHQNLLGGEVLLKSVTATFCPGGYYTPESEPGTELCKRINFDQPGNPQQFVIEWNSPDAEWRTWLPESSANLSEYTALHLRVALDPLAELNQEGAPQSFSIELVDASNQRAQVVVSDIEYPAGARRFDEFWQQDIYTGHVHMATVRIPLEDFTGVDLANTAEIALLFDQSPGGALFLADLALLKGDAFGE
jgi:hypothetical protein